MKCVVFVSSALQQPRHQKRIDVLKKYFNCNVFYFSRSKYNVNLKGYDKGAVKIGCVKDGVYFSRFFLLLKLFFLYLKSSTRTVYCTSTDQAVVAVLAGKSVTLEVGDLQQLDGKGRYLQFVDRFLCKSLHALVLTSPFFMDYYAGLVGKATRVLVVENKLAVGFRESVASYRRGLHLGVKSNKVKIGVVGNFTNVRTLTLLREVLNARQDLELHIYGEGVLSVFEGVPRCFYHGPFRSPEDLCDIYNNIDINYVVYDDFNNNVKLALPNKLYESIAFLRPLICTKGVALEKVVLEKGVGLSVALNERDVLRAIDALITNYIDMQNNMLAIPESDYIDHSSSLIPSLFLDSKEN